MSGANVGPSISWIDVMYLFLIFLIFYLVLGMRYEPRNESPSLESPASCTDGVTPLGDIMTNTTSSSHIAEILSFRAPTGGVVSLSTLQSSSRNFFRFLTSFVHFVASTVFCDERHCIRTSVLPIERSRGSRQPLTRCGRNREDHVNR